MFVTFKVLASGRFLERVYLTIYSIVGNKRNSDTQMVLRLKCWDDLTAPADTVVMAIDKKSNPNQVETLSLTEVPPVSLSIWGKDRICTPLARVGATKPTWPFLLTAIVLLMCLQPSHCNHLRVGLLTASRTVGCPMTILGHPTHSDAPVHRFGDLFGTLQGPSRNAAMFNKLHSKCCPAQKSAKKTEVDVMNWSV